jgi:hypothetical protein
MKIGVVGYSSNNFDEALANELLLLAFKRILSLNIDSKEIEIVSGLTNIGVPKLAYQIADSFGYTKVGISAARALKVNCGVYKVDKIIIEGEEFGDESEVFVDYIDYLVRVGGGKQSITEVGMFSRKCKDHGAVVRERLIEYELNATKQSI